MKNNNYLQFLTLLAILSFQTSFLSAVTRSGEPPNTKAEQLKTKFNSGEFSISAFVFTENNGQIVDQNYQARPDVLFGGQNKGLTFHLRNNGISYQLYRVESWKEEEDHKTNEKRKVIDQQTIYRIDIDWLNANAHALLQKTGATKDVNNFYTEGCPVGGALNVKSYKEVTYQSLYTGIDLKWYEKNGDLKYDYLCAAGSDYNQIQLQIKGAETLILNERGELVIKTPLGTIIEKAPLVIQNNQELKSRWILKNHIISFDIDNLNQNLPYVIDPAVRLWGTYYGGAGLDYGQSCATDGSGNVYLAGYTASNNGTSIATAGSHQSTFGGGTNDAFLVKFNASGVRQWGTYYGGMGSDDFGQSCATDGLGNVYLAGYTSSNSGTVISTPGSQQAIYGGGGNDAFLVKFNSSGVRVWGTYYGGAGLDQVYSCATDGSGNVYMAGLTQSSTGTVIATTGSHQLTFGGGTTDAFLVKFDALGVRLWGTYYGGAGSDPGYSCAADVSGNVYLTGLTGSNTGTVIASAGSHQSTNGGSLDGFLVKFSASGVRLWGTFYGGLGVEEVYSCATDGSGNVYLAGHTQSNGGTIISTVGSHQAANAGGLYDAYLVKFNSSGVRQWGTYYGGTQDDRGYSCNTDGAGNVYLAGATQSNNGTVIATAGSHQSTGGGSLDAFLVKFNGSGVRQWGSYFGGAGVEEGTSCSTAGSGNVYLTGRTTSNTGTIIATTGSHQSTLGGGTFDVFLVKFSDTGGQSIIGNSIVCQASGQTYSIVNDPLATNYTWSLPPSWTGTSTTNVISVVPLASGNISVVTNYSASSGPVQTLSVTVNPKPTATISPAGSTTFCPIYTITLSAPPGMTSYSWSTGATTQTIGVNDGGNYNVLVTDANGCTNASLNSTLINVLPSDINKTGLVDINDYLLFVPAYGIICNCNEDIDRDGDVDVNDYLIFVPAYGTSCQ